MSAQTDKQNILQLLFQAQDAIYDAQQITDNTKYSDLLDIDSMCNRISLLGSFIDRTEALITEAIEKDWWGAKIEKPVKKVEIEYEKL